MKRIGIIVFVIYIIHMICFVPDATCVILGFEGIVSPGDYIVPATPYQEAGFILNDLTNQHVDGIFSSSWNPDFYYYNSNGTDAFGWCGGCGEKVIFRLTHVDGIPFSIQSLDATSMIQHTFTPGMGLDVVGHRLGGETVTQTFILIQNTWKTFSFDPTFTNLIGLDISANAYPVADLTMDNINVTPIPEPSTFLLLATGLLGIIGYSWPKKSLK